MHSSVLLLHETNAAVIDGDIPSSIELLKDKIVIGRGSPLKPVDIVLSAKKESKEIISRQHAEIIRHPNGEFEIRDLKALNGIFVNGVRVLSKVLRHLDVIQFGGLCDVPVGKTLETSDLCVKYKFMHNHILSSSNKRRVDEEVNTSPSKSGRLDISVRSHSPLNGRMQSAYPKLQLNSKSPSGSSPERKVIKKSVDDLVVTKVSVKNPINVQNVNPVVLKPTSKIVDVASSSSGVMVSALREALNCTLCSEILLDAVVLQCSHGYCRCCIERHVRLYKSTCPVCNDRPAVPLTPSQKKIGEP